MNVLIVNHRLDADGGGTARKAVTLAKALRDAGCGVELAAFDFGPPVEPGAEVHTYHVPFTSRRWPFPSGDTRGVTRQVTWADVVVLVNHWTTINALYAHSAWRHDRPVVVMPCGALPIFGRSRWTKRLYNAVIGRRIIHRARAAIAVTPLETRDFAPYGVAPDAVEVIPNAISPTEGMSADPARFRERWNLREPFLLFAGRVAAIKGPDLLLQAWERVAPMTSLHLVIAGSPGDMGDEVTAWIAAHGEAMRVRWLGALDHAALYDAFSAAHAVVVPSRSEAMSLVLLEAALTGCPVIATTACGVPDVARHGGLEVEATDASLATALLEAATWSTTEARERGARLEAFVRGTYTWSAVTPRYLDVLARAAGRS